MEAGRDPRNDPGPEMEWERWGDWDAVDPRWQVLTIDTTSLPVTRVADELLEWIEAERARFHAGVHPLAASLW